MIKRKKKICKGCGKEEYIWANGLCKPCHSAKNPYEIKKSPLIPKTYRIANVSKAQKERNKTYKQLRDEYMSAHKVCEVCNQAPSEQLHHKGGRVGDNLFKNFLAVCHSCHVRIELNPDWAKENGYSINRLN